MVRADVQINLAEGYEEGMENCNLNSGGREGICKKHWKFTMKLKIVKRKGVEGANRIEDFLCFCNLAK